MSAKNLKEESKLTLRFYEKNVYGNVLIYCYDKSVADILRTLTNKKTVDRYDLEALRKLGLDVELDTLPESR